MYRLLALVPAALLLTACGGGGTSGTAKTGAVAQTIQISEKEFSLTPSTTSLSQAGTFAFDVTNDGKLPHAFEIEGNGVEEKTGDIAPGATKTVRATFSKNGSYEMYCPIDGHKEQGMKGTITVGNTAGSGGMTTGETTTSQTTTSAPGY